MKVVMFLAAGLLAIAIAAEVAASAALPRADGFRDPMWTALVLGGYGFSIWLLTLVVRTIPVSVTYAIWAGVGTAAIAAIGVMYLDEPLGLTKITALALIISGVVLLNLRGAH